MADMMALDDDTVCGTVHDARMDEIQQRLDAGVPAEMLSSRVGPGGQKLTYVANHDVFEMANTIFGFSGWSSNIIDVTIRVLHL